VSVSVCSQQGAVPVSPLVEYHGIDLEIMIVVQHVSKVEEWHVSRLDAHHTDTCHSHIITFTPYMLLVWFIVHENANDSKKCRYPINVRREGHVLYKTAFGSDYN
jgi:hypothetical protein